MSKLKIVAFGDRTRVRQETGETSLTQQSLAAETDINAIMRKYEKTGVITHVARYAGEYGDFSGVPDYKTGLERIMAADEMFASLPARIRDRFGNDPANFIEFATNPENLPELRKMGLAPEEAPPPKPQLVQVVEPPEPAQPAPKSKPAKGDQ